MELKDFIQEYHAVLPYEVIGSLVKYVGTRKFSESGIIRDNENHIDKSIRNVQFYPINACQNYTDTHWHNLLCWVIKRHLNLYKHQFKKGISATEISSVEILKYEKNMFYKVHTDYHLTAPRTVSVIIYLNNDYEGGTTSFFHPETGEKIFEAKPEPGKLIMWPSNFMYPHSADPVTKGTRYVVVSWIS